MSDENVLRKPTICIDFDGVIHAYTRGWQDGSIYDPPVAGFKAWAESASQLFRLVVYSSRSQDTTGNYDMTQWMREHDLDPDMFTFSKTKPPAWLTIDDRCVRFDGDWSAPELTPAQLLLFKPWTQRKA